MLKIATNIQGKNPVGTTAANTNPITIAGVDGDNKIKGLVLNNDGAATVVVTSNSDIMGAVLNHGDIPNIVKNTPLLANATFTQDTIDRQEQVIPIGSTRIWVNADQSGTLYLEESHNGTNWTTTATNVVSAGVQVIRDWTVLTRRYVRIRYVNGATAQGSFKIQQYFIGVGVTPVRAEDGTIVSIGSKADAAVTDPSLSGSEIALLKGLLTKLNTIIDGTTPATTVLTGSSIADTDKSNFLPTKTVVDRTVPVLLRTVTTNDVLDNPVIDTVSGQDSVGGSLVSATAYKYSICAVNGHGSTIPITIATATPGGTNNSLRLPISQVTNATGYVVFLSTDTQPKMVLQITEAQRAAGGVCTTAFEYAEGGIPGAIDIGVVGTGAATNAACFTTMTAYTPELVTDTIINTYNKSNLAIEIRINFDDYRVSPYLNYIVASRLVAGEGDWVIFQGTLGLISIARRRSVFTFGGAAGVGEEHTVLIYGLSGQNISLPITAWYY